MPEDRYLPGLHFCRRCNRAVRVYAETYLDRTAIHCANDHRHVLAARSKHYRHEPTQQDVDAVAMRAGGWLVTDGLTDDE